MKRTSSFEKFFLITFVVVAIALFPSKTFGANNESAGSSNEHGQEYSNANDGGRGGYNSPLDSILENLKKRGERRQQEANALGLILPSQRLMLRSSQNRAPATRSPRTLTQGSEATQDQAVTPEPRSAPPQSPVQMAPGRDLKGGEPEVISTHHLSSMPSLEKTLERLSRRSSRRIAEAMRLGIVLPSQGGGLEKVSPALAQMKAFLGEKISSMPSGKFKVNIVFEPEKTVYPIDEDVFEKAGSEKKKSSKKRSKKTKAKSKKSSKKASIDKGNFGIAFIETVDMQRSGPGKNSSGRRHQGTAVAKPFRWCRSSLELRFKAFDAFRKYVGHESKPDDSIQEIHSHSQPENYFSNHSTGEKQQPIQTQKELVPEKTSGEPQSEEPGFGS